MGVSYFEQAMREMGLEPRSQQTKLVEHIRSTVKLGIPKFVQAGTGTGKSFAFLLAAYEAAVDSGLPSVVVCPMNSLIDQYVNKDAPRIQAVVGGKFTYIKGRSRYLCAQSKALQLLGSESKARDEYARLTANDKVEWADHGLDFTFGCPGSGDCTSADAWQENGNCEVHGLSTMHAAGCGGAGACSCGLADADKPRGRECTCTFFCGAFEAKRKAESADVIITNAHVLVWDYLVQRMSLGQVRLLPKPGALFVDECHELEAVGRACQSDEIKPGSKVYDVVPGLRDWVDVVTLTMIQEKQSEGLLGRVPEIVEMARLAEQEARFLEDKRDEAGIDRDLAKEYDRESRTLMRFVDFVAESEQHISTLEVKPLTPNEDPKTHLHKTCVDTSFLFREILTSQPTVLVSGTIPQSEPRRLGVSDYAKIEDVGHPFDYSKSVLAISPLNAANKANTYSRAQQAAQAINSRGGGALILFTSWKDLNEVMPMISMNLDPAIRREIYVQSKEEPETLKQDIADFKAHGSAVLAGVRTLFTGLDIPGPALRTLVMWKLPYLVPSLEAKAIERVHGREVYWDAMRTILIQGIGRLIRSTDDQGLVFIADNRADGQNWRANLMTRHLAEFTKHVPPRRA